MIEVKDDDPVVLSLREFFKRKGRPPMTNEMGPNKSVPSLNTIRSHFKGTADEIWSTVFGIKPLSQLVEEYVRKKSLNGARPVFYLTSKEIAVEHKLSIRRLGAYMRKLNKPGMLVAGYQLEGLSRGDGTRKTFMATKSREVCGPRISSKTRNER